MLIQLTPAQITANWDFLKEHVLVNTPLESIGGENRLNNVLNGLLVGDLHCWAEATADEQGFHIVGIIVTQFLVNYCADVKNLLIYALVGIDNVFNIEKWERGLLTLTQFARKHECSNIIAYTDNVRIIRLAERFKANTSQRLIVFQLHQ